MIQHTVAFRLAPGVDESAFLERAGRLATIGGVHRFSVLRQVGTKNDFTHALSMHFETQADYDNYNTHDEHVAFVNDVWIPAVAEFIELDYVAHEG